ncbi:ABC transporter substrate-binding protein [Dactylosporangium roseum]|uniref:ABC transporter substrate-binding protein n=1 Tax=Dactylosporangium roseum TaxID=47989 RepID=A0ABY5ZFI1_9ACTN|nr:ABC transporter substrate-binding protein [Dactylosporangium roseum]UWZ39720.1 ABC transporter substrate-binding protein [Dactylosporangium roseum]
MFSNYPKQERLSDSDAQAGRKLTRRGVLQLGGLGSAFLIAGPGLLAACSSDTTPKSSGLQRGGSLQIAIGDASTTDVLDPAKSINQFTALLGGLIFDPLLRQDLDFKPQPALATKWSVSSDARQWTFDLRDDVVFHDGTALTSEDVAFSIARHLDKSIGSRLYGRLSASLKPEGIKTPSKTQVVLNLETPDGLLAVALASRYMFVLKKGTTSFDGKVSGTGPFELANWTPGASFVVKRSEKYWASGRPYLDEIRGIVVADPASRLRSVTSGPSDILDTVDFTLAPSVEKQSNVKLANLKSSFFVNFAMDQTQAPFDDVRVRKAFKLALDREKFLQVVFGGHGTISGDVPVLPSDPTYPANTLVKRDVEQAKRLLAEAGYPNGIDVELVTAPLRAGMVDAAVVFAESVKDAGIRVQVKQQPSANYFTSIWLKVPFYVSYWATRQSTEEAALTLVSNGTSNESRFANPEFDKLIQEARTSADEATRNQKTKQALEIAAIESGWIIPAIIDTLTVMKRSVQDVALNSMQILDMSGAWKGNS